MKILFLSFTCEDIGVAMVTNIELSFNGKEDHPPNRFTLASVYMRKKLTSLPEPRADNNARACSDCFALTDMTRLGR